MSNAIPRYGQGANGLLRVETQAYRSPGATSATIGESDLIARLRAAEDRAAEAEQQLAVTSQALVVQQGQGERLLQMLAESRTFAASLQRDCDSLRREVIEYQISLTQKDVIIAELTSAGYQIEQERLERTLAEVRAKLEAALEAPSLYVEESDTKVIVVG